MSRWIEFGAIFCWILADSAALLDVGCDFSYFRNPLAIAPLSSGIWGKTQLACQKSANLENPWRERRDAAEWRGEMLKWPPRRDVSLASSFTRCRTRNNPNKNKFRALCGLFSQHVGVLGVGGRKKRERSALCSVKCIEIISECLLRRYEGGVSCDVRRRSVDERQTFKLFGIPQVVIFCKV